MSNNSTQAKNTVKEIAELVAQLGKWGVLIIGGLCLLLYANEIGGFPEGLQLGEGLAFYMVSAGFLIVYGFYVAGLTALGCSLMRWPMHWVQMLAVRQQKRHATAKTKRPLDFDPPTDLAPMWDGAIWGGAALGLLLCAGLSASLEQFGFHVLVALVQGFLFGCLLISRRRNSFRETGLASVDWHKDASADQKSRYRVIQFVLVLMIVIAPMLVGRSQLSLVDAGFRVAQLRKENAVIQIKKPWGKRLLERGKKSSPSFLGDEYSQFEGVRVLLRSVGSKVIIELPAYDQLPTRSLSIPSELIFVE